MFAARLLVTCSAVVSLGTLSIGCGDDAGPCDGIAGPCVPVAVGASATEVQAALLNAPSGSTVAFAAGTYHFRIGLSLDTDGIRLVGQGMDRTVLSFKGQTDGAQGLLVTADDFVLEDLAIEDTRGDAVKIEGGNRIQIRRTRVEWTAGPNASNGAYGLYPVQCKNVLIEDSVAIGASDAGIYVGQSENVVVRRNQARQNVAGIEIENCKKADVYDNVATGNTGGILIFNLPGLPAGNGSNTRVYRNQILANNTANFAPPGNIVGVVPAGTGMVILAQSRIEVFENEIRDHRSANIGIISYYTLQRPFSDQTYDPFPLGLWIHDNQLTGQSDGPNGALGTLLIASLGEIGTSFVVPDVVWDGVMDPSRMVGGDYAAADKLCFARNGDANFINLAVPPGDARLPTTSAAPHACTLTALPPVTLEGISL